MGHPLKGGGDGISVVIVTWNGWEDLQECLAALDLQSDSDFEILVVDNGSSDGTPSKVRALFPHVRVIEAGENLGFAEGCNRGIDAAQGAWIATLNNDAVPHPDWIRELRAAARGGDAHLGMLQSRILFRHDPSRTNSTGVLLFGNGRFADRACGEPDAPSSQLEEVFCVSAGAALYRRATLEDTRLEHGYFDRRYFMYYEDVDLGWRARLAGWSALYVPTAVVLHAFHGSSRKRGGDFVKLHCTRNRVRTLLRNASPALIARGLPRTAADLGWTIARGGPSALRELGRAAREAIGDRAAIAKTARRPRREVERRWAVERGW